MSNRFAGEDCDLLGFGHPEVTQEPTTRGQCDGHIDADIRLERLLRSDESRWLIFYEHAIDEIGEIEFSHGELLGGDSGKRRLLFLANHLLDGLKSGLRFGQNHARRFRLGVRQKREFESEFEKLVAYGFGFGDYGDSSNSCAGR